MPWMGWLGYPAQPRNACAPATPATRACRAPACPQVVPPLQLTLEQLAQHDGRDPGKPLLLSICGTVLDVTAGEAPGRVAGLGGAWPAFL